MRTLSAHVSAIVHATEEVVRVKEAMNNVCPSDKFEAKAELKRFKGHYGNEITTLSLSIRGRSAKTFLLHTLGLFQLADRLNILRELENRIDDNAKVHLRLDKQECLKGNFQLSDQDPVKVEISFQIEKRSELGLQEQVRRHVVLVAESIGA